MRTHFPTSLDHKDINDYIKYLIVVAGIFVIVALFLYATVIAFAIASKKSKRFTPEAILKFNELHRRKGHITFIVITIFTFFLVVEAVIFGLVENSRLHAHVVQIAMKPTTVLSPAAQVVVNVNETVGDTAAALDHSILLVERVLQSVLEISQSIDFIYDSVLDVQNQFNQVEGHYNDATGTLNNAQDNIQQLNTYQDEGDISGVPDPSIVQTVNDTINSTLTTANEFLNDTINTIGNVLITVNTTIADAVSTGNTTVNKAKDTLHVQIAKLQDRMQSAIDSIRGPNSTISDISHTSIKYANLLKKILIVVFVFALIPLILVFIGLVAKVPMLYKFAFAASFLCMFWLIAIGGVFAVVHTAFSQACDSREVLVINGIHKFTPDQYVVNLGNINIGPNSTGDPTEVIISLNSTTLHSLLYCANPTNFFDVFGLKSLIDSVFGQIYAQLDKLQQEQSEFFDSTSTTDGVNGFQNATQNLASGSYLDNFYGMQDSMHNISTQAGGLVAKANDSVNNALSDVNNITQNVTTTQGDAYSFLYTLANVTGLDISKYPFNETTAQYQTNLQSAQTAFTDAIQQQGTIGQKVSAITNATETILNDINNFQNILQSTLNVSTDVNKTLAGIQNQLDIVSALIPEIYQNITDAINSVRDILSTVSNSLRSDTQCGFAGEFFTTFSDEICRTSKKNAQAMCAALLIMGIAYFFVCILGIGLLKRRDVHRLMEITEKGLQKIASMRVINRTISMVNTVVRSTSEVFKPMRASSRNVNVRKEEGTSSEPEASNVGYVPDDNYRFSRSVVKFSEVPYVEGEGPGPQIKRNESLSRVTSALRNSLHRRTISGDRSIAHAQEIPYTELDEMPTSSSSESVPTSPQMSNSGEMNQSGETDKSGEIHNNNNKTITGDNRE